MSFGLPKEYLGDSVYAEFDGYTIALTTENGLPEDPSNIIYLDGRVLGALIRYVEEIRKKHEAPNER